MSNNEPNPNDLSVTEEHKEIENTGILYWENSKTKMLHFDFQKSNRKLKYRDFVDITKKIASPEYPKQDEETHSWVIPIEVGLMVLSLLVTLAADIEPPKKRAPKNEPKETETQEAKGKIVNGEFTSGKKSDKVTDWFLYQADIITINGSIKLKAWGDTAKKYAQEIKNNSYYALIGEKAHDSKFNYDYLLLHSDSFISELSYEQYEGLVNIVNQQTPPPEVINNVEPNKEQEINPDDYLEDEPIDEEPPESAPPKPKKERKNMANNNTAITKASDKSQLELSIEQYASGSKNMTYTYKGAKDVPNSAKVQNMVNELKTPLLTQVIEVDKNNDMAKAIVRVTNNITGHAVESAVVFYFDIVKQTFLLDLIRAYQKEGKKAVVGRKSDGEPILSEEALSDLWGRFLAFRAFAERTAVTQAARSAQLKMLNQEWREKEEIAMEFLEQSIVQKGKEE